MRRTPDFIPSRPEELTAQWCSDAMRSAGAISGMARVTSVTREPLSGGTGMAGETLRLRFTYEGAEGRAAPATAVAKFASPLPVIKGLLESIDAYGREVAFYKGLAGSMPLRVPQFLGGGADPGRSDRGTRAVNRVVDGLPSRAQLAMTVDPTKLLRPSKRRYALLIEDLGDDLVVHDVVNPPSPQQLRVPLAELAKLHAAFWGRTDLQSHGATSQLVCSTPRLYQNVYHGRVRALMSETWDDWLTDEHLRLADEANEKLGEDLETINRGVTLVHGDPRSDNLLFSEDGSSVTFVDWSLPAYAHPAYDVGYHLSACLKVEDADHVEPLGDFYLEALAAAGKEIDRREFWSVVRATMRAMLAQQVQAIPHPLSGYGDKNLEDYWAPRLMHALMACPS